MKHIIAVAAASGRQTNLRGAISPTIPARRSGSSRALLAVLRFPRGFRRRRDIKMKGSFKVYNAMPESLAADVVPDLTFTQHYGF